MYLPNDMYIKGVILLYTYFILSFSFQLSIMFDNGSCNVKRFSFIFLFLNIRAIFNNYILYIHKNYVAVICTGFVVICLRVFAYKIFGLLDTYNTVTVLVFIVSHY